MANVSHSPLDDLADVVDILDEEIAALRIPVMSLTVAASLSALLPQLRESLRLIHGRLSGETLWDPLPTKLDQEEENRAMSS